VSTPRVEEVEHRGVRWQRAPNGAVRWRDTEEGEWVRYRRGDDAPPRPPGWEPRKGLLPAGVTVDRPSWRTPYRIVPVVLIVAVLVVGAVQALSGSGGQAKAETKAADALVGKCLVSSGFSDGRPTYSAHAVACGSVGALVKVTEVLPGTPGSPSCPQGTTPVVLAFPGVRYPHQLCTVVNGG
jgi:hypothetical protein